MLPVELVAFDALLDGNTAVLTWRTVSETNNAGFEVQHRAAQAYEVLGFVEGAGTTLVPQDYVYTVSGLSPGPHRFRLKQVDYDGTLEYSPEVEVVVDLSGCFVLSAAYPNPFNAAATFTLVVAKTQQVQVQVFDVLGRRVAQLYDGSMAGGVVHPFTFEARGLPGGLYIIYAAGEHFTATHQVAFVR